jgi:glycosyltransferase involved in cell wall biosynthesis
MKILLINTYYEPNGFGGAERSVKIIAEGLMEAGHEVSVITSDESTREKKINNVSVYYQKAPNIYWLYKSDEQSKFKKILWHFIDSFGLNNLKETVDQIKKLKPDIVITNNTVQFSSALFREIKKTEIPVIHVVRDHYLICFKTTMFINGETCKKQCATCKFLSFRKKSNTVDVDAVVGISQYILDKHLDLGYFKKTPLKKIIPNTILKEQSRLKREFKKKGELAVFGFAGNLTQEKGIDFLLDTFIKGKVLNELRIYGNADVELVSMLKKKFGLNSNIRFLGFKSPEVIFSEIDYLIVPSQVNEAFGRVIIESYSFAVPVIGIERGGIPELIHSQLTGYLFSTQLELLEIIQNCSEINENYLKLSQGAHAESKKYHNLNSISRYLKLIDTIKLK